MRAWGANLFKEILKIIPRLDRSDLDRMERTLNQRFQRVARRFATGITRAFRAGGKVGGIFTILLTAINRLINPLQETQAAIDRMLTQADDLVTNARHFGTDAGKLFKLQQLAKSTGVDEQALFNMMSRFQGAVAQAAVDPTRPSAVREFVGIEDTADAFFEFIQSLQKMDRDQSLVIQQEVFGERQILKLAEFLQTDFEKQIRRIGARQASDYTPSIEKLGNLQDFQEALEAKRNLEDMRVKGRIINKDMILQKDSQEKLELERENRRIRYYEGQANLQNTVTQIFTAVETGFLMIADLTKYVKEILEYVKNFSVSRSVRGMFRRGGDK